MFLFSSGQNFAKQKKSNADCSVVCRAADKVIGRPVDIFVFSGENCAKQTKVKCSL